MKKLSSIFQKLVTFLAIGLLILLSIMLFASAPRTERAQVTETGNQNIMPSLVPPIALEKLEISKVSRFDADCTGISIAPDSEQYLCLNFNGEPGLWLGSFISGIEKKLIDKSASPAWLPDSKSFVYAEFTNPGQSTPLMFFDIDSATEQEIGALTGSRRFQVNPNGNVIFTEDGQLYVWDFSTRTTTPLELKDSSGLPSRKVPESSPSVLAYAEATFDSTFKISPDVQYIASQKTFYEGGALYLIDIPSGKVLTLTEQIGDLTEAFAWSPDGKTLAYSIRPLDTRIPELWIVNADGSSPHQVLKGEWGTTYQHLVWLPDGQTLLFNLDAGGNSYDDGWSLMAVSLKDSSVKQLLLNGSGIRLFDEGRKILFSRNSTDIGIWIAELSW